MESERGRTQTKTINYEAGGDRQLARFQADPANRGRVLDQGFWRYTRHPNYFGDCCVWWGLYVIAAAGGAWATILSPVVMTALLLKVSGVARVGEVDRRAPTGTRGVRTPNQCVFPRPAA